MCGLCGVLGGKGHWSDSAAAPAVFASRAEPQTRGRERQARTRLLNVVLLNNPKKAGDNFVTGTPGAVQGQVAGQVRSGALEGSGADPTQSMVDMMESLRAYESGQKVIQTIDTALGKAASEVGRVSG